MNSTSSPVILSSSPVSTSKSIRRLIDLPNELIIDISSLLPKPSRHSLRLSCTRLNAVAPRVIKSLFIQRIQAEKALFGVWINQSMTSIFDILDNRKCCYDTPELTFIPETIKIRRSRTFTPEKLTEFLRDIHNVTIKTLVLANIIIDDVIVKDKQLIAQLDCSTTTKSSFQMEINIERTQKLAFVPNRMLFTAELLQSLDFIPQLVMDDTLQARTTVAPMDKFLSIALEVKPINWTFNLTTQSATIDVLNRAYQSMLDASESGDKNWTQSTIAIRVRGPIFKQFLAQHKPVLRRHVVEIGEGDIKKDPIFSIFSGPLRQKLVAFSFTTRNVRVHYFNEMHNFTIYFTAFSN